MRGGATPRFGQTKGQNKYLRVHTLGVCGKKKKSEICLKLSYRKRADFSQASASYNKIIK